MHRDLSALTTGDGGGLAQKAGSGEKAGSEPSKCRVRTKVPSQGPGEVQGECRASAG
jgi:hypothetical protein